MLCDGGRIRTAEHVYQQLERSFGTEAWRQTAEEKARAISRFSFKFMTGVIGQYLLFEAYDEDKDGDVIWLARAVADEGLGGRCCKQMSKRTLLHRDESRSTAFSVGDWAIAVEWIERTGSDPKRLTFGPSDGVVCFVNSTELRHIVAKGGVFPRAGGQQGEFALERKEEADAGEQQTRNKTKTKRHTGNAPRAQLRRARCSCVQFTAMSKAAEPRDSDHTKHQKTQNPALVSQ